MKKLSLLSLIFIFLSFSAFARIGGHDGDFIKDKVLHDLKRKEKKDGKIIYDFEDKDEEEK